MQSAKAVYIMFSSTHCGMGSFIRLMTGEFYNHVSVSFDENLSELYSFARIHKRTPLYAGFVHESCMRYRDFSTPVKVCKINLCSDDYEALQCKIDSMMHQKDSYIYNLASAIAYPLKHKISIGSAYTCVEFVSNLLEEIGLASYQNGSGFCSIKNLEALLDDYVIYEDIFPKISSTDWQDDVFNEPLGVIGAVRCTLRNNARLVKRLLVRSSKN